MSEKEGKKFPIKLNTSSSKSQAEESQIYETENLSENKKPRKIVITTEIATRPKIVGAIPPWDDDDDSQEENPTKPPTITTEIPAEDEKIQIAPRATGEIPPWDDEEESKS